VGGVILSRQPTVRNTPVKSLVWQLGTIRNRHRINNSLHAARREPMRHLRNSNMYPPESLSAILHILAS